MKKQNNQCNVYRDMLSFIRKPLRKSFIFGLLGVPLVFLPAVGHTAKVVSVLASGPQTTVNDQGDDGITKMVINFSDTTGVWLDMEPSATALNEKFQISLLNNTGEDISELWFEVTKQEGEDLGTRPTLDAWENSISASQFGSITVSESNFITDQTDRQRFHMKFDPPLSSEPGNSMTIISDTDWIDFNKSGGKWWLNIDWNEEDNNGPSGTTPSQLTPSIFANDGEGPLTIQSGENLSISVSLKSGTSAGKEADWWVAAQSPEFGWFHYTIDNGWQLISSDLSDLQPGYQGELFDIASPLELLSSSDIPKGSYTFFFGVDQNMNGVLDIDQLVFDSVQVVVE